MIPQPADIFALSLWTAHHPAQDVLEILDHPKWFRARTLRLHLLLTAMAHLSLGHRDEAWRAGLEADLAGVPFWVRGRVRAFLGKPPDSTEQGLRRCRRLLRWAPFSVRLRHRLALLHHRAGNRTEALDALERCLPMASEDPLVLEDLLRTALDDLPACDRGPAPPHEGASRLRRLIHQALALLTQRHGDPRLGWDRAAPALHLLQEGDAFGALFLIHPVPPALRNQTLWEVEALALRSLGQSEPARRSVEAGLEAHPTSYRLWMERHHLDLLSNRPEAAREALDHAARCLPAAHPGFGWEWHLRRAAFAHFIERDPDRAWDLLKDLPREAPDDHHPPLRLQVRLALGEGEEAFAELRPLLARDPGDLDLRLMAADCLAAMGAWDSLAEHLEDLPIEAQERPAYWHLKGIAAAHRHELLAALEALERAAHMAPGDLRLVLDAGHASVDLADHDRAEIHWRQALRIDPFCAEALVNLAGTLRQRHDPEGARRLLRECLLHHPDHEEAQLFLAELEAN